MVPSLLEGLLGLWLVWVAVLDPALADEHPASITMSAIVLILLGIAAYRSDYLKWPGVVDVAVGIVLLALCLAAHIAAASALTFWALFWSGCVVGVVSFWSVFYRQGPTAEGPS